MAQRTITLRLQAKDADKVLSALRQTGAAGERMADTLERSGRRGSRGLAAVDRASRGVQNSMQGFAARIPIVGNALAALGPAGIAGAAGIAALTLGLAAGMRVARDAVRAFDDIAKRADTFNLLTDTLQGLRLAAIEEDVGIETMERGLNRLAVGASQAAIGTGTLITALGRSHPELVEAIGNADTMEQRLRLVTTALRESRNETEFNNIAYAAFGRSGLDMARMLARAGDGIDGLTERAREMGVVVEEHVLRNAEEMENRLGVAAQVLDLNLKQAFVDLAPIMVSTAELFGDLARGLSSILDNVRALEDQSTARLEARAEALRAELAGTNEIAEVEATRNVTLMQRLTLYAQAARVGAAVINPGSDLRRRMSAPEAQLARIDAELARRAAVRPGNRTDNDDDDDNDNGRADRLTAANEAAAREREALQIRRQLGDITGLLAQKESELADLVAHGNITRAEASAEMRRYRTELEGSTESGRAAAAVVASVQTPLEEYNARLFELDGLLASSAITQSVHMRAVIAATDAYEAADPALVRAREIRESLMTADQMLAREQERVNELIAAGALEYGEAADYLEQYRQSLEETAGQVEGLRFEQELLDRVLKGQIETWDDLGRVALSILADIIRQSIAATDASQGFGSFLASVIGNVLGTGGAPSTGSAAGFDAGFASASVPSASSAPITQVSASAAAIVAGSRASARGPGGSGLSINMPVTVINQSGSEVSTRERRSPNGDRELEVLVHRVVDGGLATGRFDDSMRGRYGAAPRPNGRG